MGPWDGVMCQAGPGLDHAAPGTTGMGLWPLAKQQVWPGWDRGVPGTGRCCTRRCQDATVLHQAWAEWDCARGKGWCCAGWGNTRHGQGRIQPRLLPGEDLTLSFLRALNFFRHSTVSCLCIMEATVERCCRGQGGSAPGVGGHRAGGHTPGQGDDGGDTALTQTHGCLRASWAVMRLAGLMVSIWLMRFFASGVTVSHSGEGNWGGDGTHGAGEGQPHSAHVPPPPHMSPTSHGRHGPKPSPRLCLVVTSCSIPQ